MFAWLWLQGRGRRDARMKEAKISRPRVSTSPIHDSLQLFRADKVSETVPQNDRKDGDYDFELQAKMF